MNICTFSGRFASKPKRQDYNDISRCFFTLIINKEGKRKDGSKYPPQAVNCVAWNGLADLICRYKDVGHLVLITSEYATYEKHVLDKDNNPLDIPKLPRPIFTVKTIEFMPVNKNTTYSCNRVSADIELYGTTPYNYENKYMLDIL